MSRYSLRLKPLNVSMEQISLLDRHFDSLEEFLGYQSELSLGGVSTERLEVIESTLRKSMYLDSESLVSLESGFFFSRTVSIESAISEGLKKIVEFIVNLIKHIFNFVMNVLTLGTWSQVVVNISEIKRSAEEDNKRTETIEIRRLASFAPQFKAEGYISFKNAIAEVFHIFDTPVFKSIYTDPTKIDSDAFIKGLGLSRNKAKPVVSALNKNSEKVPFQLQISLESQKSLFTVNSKAGGSGAFGEMIQIPRSECLAILDQALALSKTSTDCAKKMHELDKQKDKVIKMLNRSLSIPVSDAQAYTETARCWSTTLQQLSMLLNYSLKASEDIAKIDFRFV